MKPLCSDFVICSGMLDTETAGRITWKFTLNILLMQTFRISSLFEWEIWQSVCRLSRILRSLRSKLFWWSKMVGLEECASACEVWRQWVPCTNKFFFTLPLNLMTRTLDVRWLPSDSHSSVATDLEKKIKNQMRFISFYQSFHFSRFMSNSACEPWGNW